jgi:sugar lactone lactonase YvrE
MSNERTVIPHRWMRCALALVLACGGCLLVATSTMAATAPTFATQWGTFGSGEGQFSSPLAIATDASGDVYVADTSNDRVEKFDSDGDFLGQWGSRGEGPGQFIDPTGIATDAAGNVYVVDSQTNRVEKFDGSGTFLTQWGSPGSGEGQFSYPTRIATDASGEVYVVDSRNDRVEKFDSDGDFLGQWGSLGDGHGQFNYPVAIATDAAGNVYVSDYSPRVQEFDSNGNFLTQWGSSGTGEGQFSYPNGIATDAAGNVYVADLSSRVEEFDSNGNFLTQWGSYGSGEGQFSDLQAIATDAESDIYVLDSGNSRVEKFSPSSPTPPLSSIALSPSAPNGLNGWYVSPVLVSVSATDSAGGPGVAETNCVLDPLAPPLMFTAIPAGCAYTGSGADVTGDGEHTVYAASVDSAGDQETPVSASFMIDLTPPTLTCDATPSYPLDGSGGPVSAIVTDATSGPATSTATAAADVSSPGPGVALVTGFDNAGNSTTAPCPYIVTQLPSITSGTSTTIRMRSPFDFSVTTTGYPTPVITESGALPSGVTFTDTGEGTADLAGAATAGTAGTYPITITASNGTGSPAVQSFVLTVSSAASSPSITSDASDAETSGVPFSFAIETTGYPAPKLTKRGSLPPGVTFVNNGDGTATIAGTPSMSAAGMYTLTLTATNSAGTATQSFTLTVSDAPTIKNIPTTTAHVGSALNLKVTAEGYMTPALTESGTLPSGLEFTDNGNGTATLAGTPAVGSGGAYTITITASNALGASSQSFTLNVDEAPTITSASTTTATTGSLFYFQTSASGFPAPKITKSGTLPKGLAFSGGAITGTPKIGTAGTYPVTITAKSNAGTATQLLVLTVQ